MEYVLVKRSNCYTVPELLTGCVLEKRCCCIYSRRATHKIVVSMEILPDMQSFGYS